VTEPAKPAKPEEPSREEMLARLEEVLQDEEEDEDDGPPDLDIPDEEDEGSEDPWESVTDGAADDIPVPSKASDGEEPDAFWDPLADGDDDDLVLTTMEDGPPDDPWSDASAAEPPALGPGRRRSSAAFSLPRVRPRPGLQPALRTLPWRSTGDLQSPALPSLLCVADATATGSRLLVAAWTWADEAAGDLLRFRVSDDGPELEATPASPHEAVIESVLKLRDLDLHVRLHLEAARDRRGIVLGRDVLAGRFVVDPSREDWSDDDD
jgi:hypothetical protein